jgi:hypothetical protein
MPCNISEDIRIFSCLVSHLGLEALVFLIQIEKQLATVPLNIFPLSQRTGHVTHLINTRFQTDFSMQKIREVKNEININQSFIDRLFPIFNSDTFINSYINSTENN